MKNTLANFLLDATEKVKSIEKKAKQAIEEKNSDLYRKFMKKKAEYLVSLSEEAKNILASEPHLETRRRVESKLESFSGNASTALQLNSTFYMSALLYPDDHKEGEPNNLEVLANSLQK